MRKEKIMNSKEKEKEIKNREREESMIFDDSPILRQKHAVAFLRVSPSTFFSLERIGIIKRHEVKLGKGKSIPFYLKDELIEAIRNL
jgi:hypothetical protein